MKDENKFLSRSRERSKWKKKLSLKPKKQEKANAIYFRPNLSDDRTIRELAEMTGETKNAIVEKLIAVALHNKPLTTQKLDEQKSCLRRLEDNTKEISDGQMEMYRVLEEIRRGQIIQERFTTSLLAEIYCMVHTAVSLVRTTLLQILRLSENETPNVTNAPQVLASFDETSDLTIARSLQDLESVAAHHQIKNGKFAIDNLYWRLKLRRADTEPKE